MQRLFALLVAALVACGGQKTTAPDPKPPVVPRERDRKAAGKLAHDFESNKEERPVSFCRRMTGYDGPAETCDVQSLGDGTVALIRIVTSCGGDHCDVEGWLVRGQPGDPLPLPPGVDASGHIEVDREAKRIWSDYAFAEPGKNFEVMLRVTEIESRKTTGFAPCFSPALSPAGRFVLCRDRAGDVLRVPVAGGTPTSVARAEVSPSDIDWAPHATIYPGPVKFTSATEFRFETELRDGEPVVKTATWSE